MSKPGSVSNSSEFEKGEVAPNEGKSSVKQLSLKFGSCNIPHPDKLEYGGEDAFFISPVGGGAFGVADGVGGWQDSGINPAEYSRCFMKLACAFLEGKDLGQITINHISNLSNGVDASLRDSPPSDFASDVEHSKKLSCQASLRAAHTGTKLPGSTTACVAKLNRKTNSLSAANLGDSGFLIIRGGEVKFKTPILQHFFDCPLQFAAYPDFTTATDVVEDANLFDIPLEVGDLIVAGTDGLWDNLPQAEIIEILNKAHDVHLGARQLACMANEHANDRKFLSPYSIEARKQGIDIPWFLRLLTASIVDGKFKMGHLKGGKIDDITVIVARVEETE